MSTASSDRLARREPDLPATLPPLQGQQLEALFAAVAEAIYIEELKSRRIVFWSPGATGLFGYAAAQVLQQSVALLCADENEFEQSQKTAVELETAGRAHGRRRYRRADGELFEAAVTATLLKFDPRLYAVCVVHPVSDAAGLETRPRLEDWAYPETLDTLDETEQLQQKGIERQQGQQMIGHLLRNVINHALFTTDRDGYIVDWNRAASRLLRYERGEVCGKHFSLICREGHERAGRILDDALQKAVEQGIVRYNQWIARKDGKPVYVSVSIFPLWGEAQPQGFLFLAREDSRERHVREKLREKEQMAAIGTAASMLAHEIGNPLNGISTTVQLLEHFVSKENLPSAQPMLSSIHDLKSEIHRLTTLLNEFKNIAWPQKLALAPVDVPRLLQALVGLIEKRASRQRIEVSVDCEAGLPLLDGDADKLKEALLHVLDNAVEAMPRGGTLRIKAYRYEEAVCIDISDTGVGIPENFKVFDLFSSTKPHGTGFGLFVVQQIVLAHDGTITYSSTPGQGTTFHLTFTVHPAPEPPSGDFVETL
jgi:PAS domain S-box-containing protein